MDTSSWTTSLRHTADVDWKKVPLVFPTRTALIQLAAVATLISLRDSNTAISVAIGVLFAGVLDSPDEFRARVIVLARSTVLWLVSVSLAMAVANYPIALVIVSGLWAAAMGYIGIVGPRMALAGLLSLVLFCIFSGTPERGWNLTDTMLQLAGGIVLYAIVAFVTTPLLAPLVRAHSVFPHFELFKFGESLRKYAGRNDAYTRHAIRLAIAIAFAMSLSQIWHFPHAYWIPMTVAWIAKPDLDGTVGKVVYRIIGTVIGVGVSIVLFGVLGTPVWAAILVIGLATWVVAAFVWVNYSYTVAGITVMVLSLFVLDGQSIWETAPWRIIATLIAGIIVTIAGYAWKTKEPEAT